MPQTFSRIILSRNIHAEKSVRQKIVVVFSPRFTLAYAISGRPIKPYRPRTFLQTCQQGSLCNPASEFRLEPFEIGRPLIPLSPPILLPLSLFFLHPFHGCVTTAWETNAIDKRGGGAKELIVFNRYATSVSARLKKLGSRIYSPSEGILTL